VLTALLALVPMVAAAICAWRWRGAEARADENEAALGREREARALEKRQADEDVARLADALHDSEARLTRASEALHACTDDRAVVADLRGLLSLPAPTAAGAAALLASVRPPGGAAGARG
jgi:hypothetical protein